MSHFPTLHILILVIANLQIQCFAFVSQSRGFCATGPPTESLKAEYRKLSALGSQSYNPVDSESRAAITPIEIDTWFHIITGEAGTESISDEMIADQLSYLQNAYWNATISYRLQGVTRSANDTWARNEDEMAMKTVLRRGSYRTLNVYFHTDLQASPNAGARAFDIVRRELGASQQQQQQPTSMLGFCTLPDPSINASSPRSAYIKDGCNVLAETMPGGSLAHYNRGGTAIHEIGHWNGLLHTFEGESCSSDNEGDFIADTPQQSKPTEGCPAQKDSCPELPGFDAIHNFMDYSSDECYDSFTPDQVSRMRSMWFAMRDGK
ncbi:extracellular metalloprotease [Aspergillus transmontanensis]|uniref:Extracellular metalloprotease n=1 Tax=Aspergillus transmontanensis TaxID=1034304 RepID=A0A5N6VDT0_9EURO|nr:extracellular metalloprotease [Aspergillus transmontanensis]